MPPRGRNPSAAKGGAKLSDGSWLSDLAAKSVTACVVAILGFFLTWLFSKFDPHIRRRQILDEGTRYVEFWTKHHKALRDAASEPDSAQRSRLKWHLRYAASYIRRNSELPEELRYRAAHDSAHWLNRWFLLYRPLRRRVWGVRFLFWVPAVLAAYYAVSATYYAGVPGMDRTTVMDMVRYFLALFTAFLFRYFALQADEPRPWRDTAVHGHDPQATVWTPELPRRNRTDKVWNDENKH